jgi:hypothetical protein
VCPANAGRQSLITKTVQVHKIALTLTIVEQKEQNNFSLE